MAETIVNIILIFIFLIPLLAIIYLIYSIIKHNLTKKAKILLSLLGLLILICSIWIFPSVYNNKVRDFPGTGEIGWLVIILPASLASFIMPSFFKKLNISNKTSSDKVVTWIFGIIGIILILIALAYIFPFVYSHLINWFK